MRQQAQVRLDPDQPTDANAMLAIRERSECVTVIQRIGSCALEHARLIWINTQRPVTD